MMRARKTPRNEGKHPFRPIPRESALMREWDTEGEEKDSPLNCEYPFGTLELI